MSKYYPLEGTREKFYPIDQNFTNFNNVAYVGNSISKYEQRATVLSNEDIFINLTQFNPIESNVIIPAAYNDARPTAILPYKASAYKLCVHAVYLPENSIYLFEWADTVTPVTGPTYDKYTVTVRYYDGVNPATSITVPLQFVPYYKEDEVFGRVKRVFEISQVIESLNQAYATAFSTLGVVACNPPVFVMDKNTSLIGIYADQRMNPPGQSNYLNPDPTTWVDNPGFVTITLGYNFWVSQWFTSSFPSLIIGSNIDGDQNTLLKIYNNSDPTLFTTIGGVTYYNIWQSNSTTDLFSTVEKVLITSSLQTRPQYTSITAVSSITNIIPNSMNSINILLDFPLTLSSANNSEVSAPITYMPTRNDWQDLVVEDSLNLLNYRIFVQRTSGVLTQVFLNPGQCCSVKLLFRLK